MTICLAIYLAGAIILGGVTWRLEPAKNRTEAAIFMGVFWPITLPALILFGILCAVLSPTAIGAGILAMLLASIPIDLLRAAL